MIPMEFLVLSLHIMLLTEMTEKDTLNRRLDELLELEEDRVLEGFHQGI